MRAALAFFDTIKARWISLRALGAESLTALGSAMYAAAKPARLQRRLFVRSWGAKPPDDMVHVAGAAALVGVGYYVGARIGFALTFPGSPLSIIWPPNTILLTALLFAPP